jgi:hypothetical protein
MAGDTTTHELSIANGTIEYQTVECALCEQDVLSDEAVPVVIGGEITHKYSAIQSVRLSGRDMQTDTVCPYCAETHFGFTGTTERLDVDSLRKYRLVAWVHDRLWIFMAILWAVIFAFQISDLVGAL